MADTDKKLRIETEPSEGFILSGKLMLGAVIILAVTVVFVMCFHIYARWYLGWARRRQLEMRRQRGGHRIRNVLNGGNIRHEDRGLERSMLSSLPVFLYSAKSQSTEEPPLDCAVCLSDFEGNDIVRHLPKCNHSFHIDCIDMWFRSHSTCPICRSRVEPVFRPAWNRVESDFTMVRGLPLSWRCDKGSMNINATSNRDESDFTMDHGLPLALRSNKGSTMNINATSNRDESNFTMVHGLPLRLRSDKANININTACTNINVTSSRDDERKGVEIMEAPPQPPPSEGLIRSPGTRLLSLKRILSMNRKWTNGSVTASTSHSRSMTTIDDEDKEKQLSPESIHEMHPPIEVTSV